ncbi:MAG: winged helix-turn-helix domain-containing protein, partial [Fibrobacterota bacterium]
SPKKGDPILSLLRSEPDLSTDAMGVRLGLTKRAILKRIQKLKSEGRLYREGAARSGKWVIPDETAQ